MNIRIFKTSEKRCTTVGKNVIDFFQNMQLPQGAIFNFCRKVFNNLQELKTGHKIIALIILMAIFLSSVGTVGYYYTGKMSQQIQEITANNLLSVKWLNEIRVYTSSTEAAITRVVNPLTIDKFFIDERIAEIKKYDGYTVKLLSDYQQLSLSPFEKERITALESELTLYRTEVQKVVGLTVAGRKPEAYTSFAVNAKPHLDAANALLIELAEYKSRQAEETSLQSQRETTVAKLTVIVTSLSAISFAIMIGLLLSRFTARRLMAVGLALNEISQGNLQFNELTISTKDDIGIIAQDVNKMVMNLRSIVCQVSQSAEQVAASSEELSATAEQSSQSVSQIATAINEVAGNANKQLKAVDQTSVTINQITEKLNQFAVNTNRLSVASEESADATKSGNEAVEKAVAQIVRVKNTVMKTAEAIVQLGERSKNVGTIVTTISEIASQTNLLSLNAAIEAARAGEHGRGFSVVAEEVRKLADQSQHATKQIAALLLEIRADTDRVVAEMSIGTNEVEVGAKAVDLAGEAFKTIDSFVQEVASQAGEISLEIKEMAKESCKIVNAIADIEMSSSQIAGQTETVSAATQQQSAAMQEIAKSSYNLSQMDEELQRAISKFKI